MGFAERAASGYALYSLFGTILIGFFCFIFGYLAYKEGKSKENWVQTNAKIISANCAPYTVTEGSKRNRIAVTKYRCDLTISYSTNGYENNENGLITNKINTDSNISYNDGQTLVIYYDPTNPNVISVDKMSANFGLIAMAIGFLVFVTGVWGFRYCWKNGCSTLGAVFFGSQLVDY